MDRYSLIDAYGLDANEVSGYPYESFSSADEPESDSMECEVRQGIVVAHLRGPIQPYLLAIQEHEMKCSVCLCERKDVVSERLQLGGSDSVCCEVA